MPFILRMNRREDYYGKIYLSNRYNESNKWISGSRPDHHGIDLAESGYHPIYAAASGRVSRSYISSSYGECIMIVHTIDGVTWETVYAHMRSGSRTVKEGDYVTQGQTIGVMGNTGDSSGQHLHFELHKGSWNINKSNAVNPLDYLGKGDGGGTTDPSDKPLQPKGLGIATSKYPEGWGINLYSGPEKMLGLQVMSLIQKCHI